MTVPTPEQMRPATALALVLLLAVIVVATVVQLRLAAG